MSKTDISQRLARLMREHGVSQSGLSRGCCVPQPTINRILNEKTKEPRRESVIRIAGFFNVTPESLYQESNEVQEDDIVALLNPVAKAMRMAEQKLMEVGFLEQTETFAKRKQESNKKKWKKAKAERK